MVQQVTIENFKSIQSLTLELGRVNVFIGENGSGKSNILEAIAMGSAAGENKLDNEFLSSRGIRRSEPQSMRSGFEKKNLKKDIKINITRIAPYHQLSFKLRNTNEIYSKWEREIDSIEGFATAFAQIDEKKLSDPSIIKFKNDTYITNQILWEKFWNDFHDFLIYSPENYFLRRFEDESQIMPLGIRGEGLFKLISILNEEKPEQFQKIRKNLALIDWFEGFEIPNDLRFTERRIRIKDRFLEEGLAYFDQHSSNEGFLYLLFYFSLFISDYTPKFFAIDNIDNAMNPKLASRLVQQLTQLAKEHDKQVIMTTHNPAVLDGLDLKDDEQRLFVISRNKLGHTKALRITHKPTPEGQEPVRLSEQFLRGYIGGLPKNF
ncbi:AAA family ATPase [Runella aurantiaca]|uniref:ATP-binding cassette domain-containing protein n=1 Tax=Runella aurantiaca TaxID=2282308 RepID=A0A369IF89_9BACT|nr:AAA family ATPase [Runella aurantiaca]RDB05894.1 ATP-binding cassette domain-containing protein [Runella aurantiaca]